MKKSVIAGKQNALIFSNILCRDASQADLSCFKDTEPPKQVRNKMKNNFFCSVVTGDKN